MIKKITSEDVYTQEVGDLYDEAGITCNPISKDSLLDLAAKYGVDEDALVLDIGCADGGVSRELLEKTGCQIEGVELLKFLVDMVVKQNKELGIEDRFRIQQGSITDIPFPNNIFDFVFCDDVIGLVEDLPKAMSECARVLKPNGKSLIYASFGTDRLSEHEANEIKESLGGASKGLDAGYAENCIKEQFKVVQKTVIGSQYSQHNTEKNQAKREAAENLLKVARLLSWPDKYLNHVHFTPPPLNGAFAPLVPVVQ